MLSWLIENTLVVLLLSAGLVLVGRLLVRRPAVLHVLWLVLLIKLITPPVVEWTTLAPAARQEVHSAYIAHVQPVVERVAESVGVTAVEPAATPRSEPSTAGTLVTGTPWPSAAELPSVTAIVLALWALGALTMIARLWRQHRRLATLRRRAIASPRWLEADVQELSRELRIRTPELCVIPESFSPGTGGSLRGRVYWPAALTRAVDRASLRPILVHELAHLRRGDHLIAHLEGIAAVIYWWHPLFWFVRARVREYAEQTCDSWAMQLAPVPPRAYAETLLGFRTAPALPAGGPAARYGGLRSFKRRLTSVMSGARRGALPAPALAAAAALLVLVLPSWSSRPAPASQDPKRPAASATEPGQIGVVEEVMRHLASVRLAGEVAVPRVGEQLAVRTQAGNAVVLLTITEVDGRVLIGRLADKEHAVAKGDMVFSEAARAARSGLASGRVEHVANRIATIKLLEQPGAPLQEGRAYSVFVDNVRVTGIRVRILQDGYVFGELLPGADAPPLHKDIDIRHLGKTPTFPARQNGPLGGPLPRHATETGHTLICDYSDNRLLEVDATGKTVWKQDKIYGAWDAELLANGHILVTEFSVSRVREIDRDGVVAWSFEDLRNPYDADRLPSGHTLIADTFRGRVIEVDKAGVIVWEFGDRIRPFDVNRLDNGNTLIADVLRDRVIEIDPKGNIVWEVRNLPSVHDADRLPNGNTLVTLRTLNRVVEIDPKGKVVFELADLNSPSDADRLSNGNTLVSENNMTREFGPNGKIVMKIEMTWAVEANRY